MEEFNTIKRNKQNLIEFYFSGGIVFYDISEIFQRKEFIQ